MIKVRLECRNAKVEEIAECLVKFGKALEYKIWEYKNITYLTLKIDSKSELDELIKGLKLACELRFSRIDFSLPWWREWMR
ncbi:MAG: hypothetical protein ACUVTD_05655 [Nitrososphaerales archaeon]